MAKSRNVKDLGQRTVRVIIEPGQKSKLIEFTTWIISQKKVGVYMTYIIYVDPLEKKSCAYSLIYDSDEETWELHICSKNKKIKGKILKVKAIISRKLKCPEDFCL